MRKLTLVSSLPTRFIFDKIGTRADANIHKEFACGCLWSGICAVVDEWTNGYFCLGCFSSPTHFYLVVRLARKVWRQYVPVFAHDLGFRDGNCNGLLANTGLFFPLVTDTSSSFNADQSLSTLNRCS